MMKGILFRSEMIKAIVEGIKTQTRRVMKPQPVIAMDCLNNKAFYDTYKPRYQVGETVYIKEAWNPVAYFNGECKSLIEYKSDGARLEKPCLKSDYDKWFKGGHIDVKHEWESPLFMPAWAARYFIKITDVRAERLQEITPEDCAEEGIEDKCGYYCDEKVGHVDHQGTINKYADLWDSINKPPYDWQSNCWVWVYSFKFQLTPPINQSSEGEG